MFQCHIIHLMPRKPIKLSQKGLSFYGTAAHKLSISLFSPQRPWQRWQENTSGHSWRKPENEKETLTDEIRRDCWLVFIRLRQHCAQMGFIYTLSLTHSRTEKQYYICAFKIAMFIANLLAGRFWETLLFNRRCSCSYLAGIVVVKTKVKI